MTPLPVTLGLALALSVSPAAPSVSCTAAPDLGPAGLQMAEKLCAALSARLPDAPADLRAQRLTVQVTRLGPTGFSARLGVDAGHGTAWGPDVTTDSMDIDHIPPAAADQAARALLSLAASPHQ